MKIPVKCGCGKRFAVQEEYAGRKGRCPVCGSDIRIPKIYTYSGWSPRTDVTAPGSSQSPPMAEVLAKDEAKPQPPPMAEVLARDEATDFKEEKARPRHGMKPVWVTVGVLNLAIVAGAFYVARSLAPKAPEIPSAKDVTNRPALPVAAVAPPVLTTQEIVANSEGSVALVKSKMGSGTGFVTESNLLVTNAHVIENALMSDLEIVFPSAPPDRRGPFKAELRHKDTKRDLAILSVPTIGHAPLKIATNYQFRRGEDVTIIGSPGVGSGVTLENAITRGVMSTKTTVDGQVFYQLGASINPGNSGGPVLDSHGMVIGVVSSRAAKQEALGFCIPPEDVREAINYASSKSANQVQELSRSHRLEVVFRTLSTLGRVYKVGLDSYVGHMKSAIDRGGKSEDGVSRAAQEVDHELDKINQIFSPNLKREITAIAGEPSYPSQVRENLTDLWANYTEMKGYIDRPRGSYNSYVEKVIELKDQHDRLVEKLNIYLGITGD